MCIEKHTKQNWEELENEEYRNNIRCYKVVLRDKVYLSIGPNGTMHKLDKATKDFPGKFLTQVVANPRVFLDQVTNPVIPYGYWTCKCKSGFIRTNFLAQCPKCEGTIAEHTGRAKYIEETDFHAKPF